MRRYSTLKQLNSLVKTSVAIHLYNEKIQDVFTSSWTQILVHNFKSNEAILMPEICEIS